MCFCKKNIHISNVINTFLSLSILFCIFTMSVSLIGRTQHVTCLHTALALVNNILLPTVLSSEWTLVECKGKNEQFLLHSYSLGSKPFSVNVQDFRFIRTTLALMKFNYGFTTNKQKNYGYY